MLGVGVRNETKRKFVTRSKTAGPQQSGIEATQVPHTRRSGDALSLPGAFSRSRATTQGSHDPHRCLGQLPQASPATSSRRSRPQAVGDRRAARWSPGGEQPRDGDDCGRALRARVSLHTRTASLGVASSCVCEHVFERTLCRVGAAWRPPPRCALAGCRSSSTFVGAPATASSPPFVWLLPPERTNTHRHRLLTITTPHVTATPPHIRLPVVCREGGSRSLLACCAGTFDATSSSM